ncbi:hypothetical protein Tco_0691003 [Tanacetum coccineum]
MYSRFIKTNDFKGVPHLLSGDYTPTPQEEIDESLYVYGKKGPQEPELNVSDDRSSEHSTCQSNDSAGSIGTSTEYSVDSEFEISKVPQEVYVSTPITTNEKGVPAPKSKEVEPSCVSHIKTPRQPIKDQETPKVNRKNCNAMMERELGEGFAEIVDFLRGSNLRYALTTNPTIHDSLVKQFWQTATAKTLANGTLELHATIDTIAYTITEASIRNKLQLADASGITMLPNNEIFEGMGHMGYPTDGSFTFWKSFFTPQWRFLVHHILHCISSKSGGWDQFGSNIATALICLSTGRVYNFSKLIFDGMVANLKSKTKFLMYPRFLQMILDIQTENKHPYLAVTLTKKIFGNMKRGFRGVPRPLLPAMLSIANPSAGQEAPSVIQPQPSSSVLMERIDDLEKQLKETKQTFGNAILTLVERVKSLEVALKRKTKRAKEKKSSYAIEEAPKKLRNNSHRRKSSLAEKLSDMDTLEERRRG